MLTWKQVSVSYRLSPHKLSISVLKVGFDREINVLLCKDDSPREMAVVIQDVT